MSAITIASLLIAIRRKRELEKQYIENSNLNTTIHLINKKNDVEIFMFDEIEKKHYLFVVDKFVPSNLDLCQLEKMIHPDDMERYKREYNSIINGELDECLSTLRIFNVETSKYDYFTHVIKPIKKRGGKVTHYIYSRRNETDVRELIAEKESIIKTLNLALKTAKIFRWVNYYGSYELLVVDHEMNEYTISIDKYSSTFHSEDDYIKYVEFVDNISSRQGEQLILSLKLPFSDSYRPYQIDGVIMRGESSESSYILGVAKDVSEEFEYQKRLRDKLELLETIKESIPIGISIYDKDGLLKSSNKAASTILGIDREKAFSQATTLFQSEEELVEALELLEAGNSLNFQFTYEGIYDYISSYVLPGMPHGNHFDVKCTPIVGEWEEIKGYVSICIDTTELVGDKLQIKELQDQITLALDASDVNIISYNSVDGYFNVIYGSRKLFDNIHINDISKFVSSADFDMLTSDIGSILNGWIDSVASVIKVVNGGEEYWLRIELGVNNNYSGRESLIGTYKDITHEMRVQQELREAKDRAQESERLKIAFLSNITHEIRTPLNAIVGFSELLSSCEDPKERECYFNLVSKNNDLLLRLVDSIIDMSRIESGTLELKLETFDFALAFFETYLLFKEKYDDSGIELILDSSCVECIVTLDKGMIFKIIDSYINNALKFTKAGFVKMSYSYKDRGIYVSIQDSGIGIAKEKIPLLFRRFDKIDEFVQGAGLGLSISKAIAESMGG